MIATFLSNAQITALAQTLTETTLGRSANGKSAQDRLTTMVIARIGQERGTSAMTEVLACLNLEAAKTVLAARIAGIDTAPDFTAASAEHVDAPMYAARLSLVQIETPDPTPPEPSKPTKQAALIAMLRRPNGASMDEIVTATRWQRHTVRGLIAGALRKRLGLDVASAWMEGRGRVYSLPAA